MYTKNRSRSAFGAVNARFFLAEVSDEALLRVGSQIVAGSHVSGVMASCCIAAPTDRPVSKLPPKSTGKTVSVRSRRAA